MADRQANLDYWIETLFEDRDTWEYGDYVVALDGSYLPGTGGARAITIRNKKTGEYVLGPIDQKMANLLEKNKFPAYTMLVAQLPDYTSSSWEKVGQQNAGRIRFFDSSKQNSPKELDGKLLIDEITFTLPSGKNYHAKL